jgi:hypothetical protein
MLADCWSMRGWFILRVKESTRDFIAAAGRNSTPEREIRMNEAGDAADP